MKEAAVDKRKLTINNWDVDASIFDLSLGVFKGDSNSLCFLDFHTADRSLEFIDQKISISCKEKKRCSVSVRFVNLNMNFVIIL